MEQENTTQNSFQSSDPVPADNALRPASPAPRRYVRPRADITETADGFMVQVEMPGVNREGLEVTFQDGALTLVGHRAPATLTTNSALLHRESRPSDFRRTFALDQNIDATGISAALEQGLLTLKLPKAEAAKSRRIEINGSN